MPHSLPRTRRVDAPAAETSRLTQQNALLLMFFRCERLKPCPPHAQLHLMWGWVSSAQVCHPSVQLPGESPPSVFQEVSTPSHPSHLSWVRFKTRSSPAPRRKSRGERWFPKRKAALHVTHSQTGSPCAKIRLYHTKLGSKWPSFATDKADGGGLGCKSSTFPSKKKTLPSCWRCKRQSFRISFMVQFVSITLCLWWFSWVDPESVTVKQVRVGMGKDISILQRQKNNFSSFLTGYS